MQLVTLQPHRLLVLLVARELPEVFETCGETGWLMWLGDLYQPEGRAREALQAEGVCAAPQSS